jgi:DNA-binding transcriptional MerR regulator
MVPVRAEYRVSEGAAFVGVHPNTLRRLARVGLIKARRNYLGYRVFSLQELLRLKATRERLNPEET